METKSEASAPSSTGKQLYQCPMHPNVVMDHPANCPICGMELEPIEKVKMEGIAGRAPVQLTNVQEQLINIRVAPVERAEAAKTLRAVGFITYDQTKVADSTARLKVGSGNSTSISRGKRCGRASLCWRSTVRIFIPRSRNICSPIKEIRGARKTQG